MEFSVKITFEAGAATVMGEEVAISVSVPSALCCFNTAINVYHAPFWAPPQLHVAPSIGETLFTATWYEGLLWVCWKITILEFAGTAPFRFMPPEIADPWGAGVGVATVVCVEGVGVGVIGGWEEEFMINSSFAAGAVSVKIFEVPITVPLEAKRVPWTSYVVPLSAVV